jgi:hypothetical protein
VLEGCYDCLLDARAILERNAGAAKSARASERRFEVELLVALREKELGLHASDAIGRARGLQAILPGGIDAGTFLMLVAAIPPDEAALPSQDRRKHLVEHRNIRQERSRLLTSREIADWRDSTNAFERTGALRACIVSRIQLHSPCAS